jgi:hypothetical protein
MFPSRLHLLGRSVVDTLVYFTFPVVAPTAHRDVCSCHAPAFVGGCEAAVGVETDVLRRILEAQSRAEGFSLGLTVVLGRFEGGICYTVCVAEVFLVVYMVGYSLELYFGFVDAIERPRRDQCRCSSRFKF